MTTPLDEHGQPIAGGYNAWSIYRRSIDEMLGLCKGVILDGHVTDSEAVALDQWLGAHAEVTQTWPGNILAQRLRTIFANAIVEEDERADLKDLLEKITGPDSDFTTVGGQSTTLPLDEPPPTILFDNYAFCFTGRFAWGPRKRCERAVAERGARVHSAPKLDTNYLVIGTFASRDWAHASYGRKIEGVIKRRMDGHACAIIGERHWAEALEQ